MQVARTIEAPFFLPSALIVALWGCGSGGGGDAQADANTGNCQDVPICAGDPMCHFRLAAEVSITCSRNPSDGDRWYALIEASGLPDHAYANPVSAVSAQDHSVQIPLEPGLPSGAEQSPCPPVNEFSLLGMKGLAINGVAITYPLSLDFVDPIAPPAGEEAEMLDYCSAHGASGMYHYHVNPPCLFGVYNGGELATGELNLPPTSQQIETSFDRDEWAKPSGIIGFSLAGHPIYGPYADAAGSAHTGLDACNGKIVDGVYGYYASDRFPYLMGCAAPGMAVADADWSCTTAPPNL